MWGEGGEGRASIAAECSHTATGAGGRPKFAMHPSHMRFDLSLHTRDESGRGCSCHTRKTPTVCPSHAGIEACAT